MNKRSSDCTIIGKAEKPLLKVAMTTLWLVSHSISRLLFLLVVGNGFSDFTFTFS